MNNTCQTAGKGITKARLRRILPATALCLAAVGLSSCYSSLHKYVWNRAEVIDEAYWIQDEKNIELYRVGDTVYAKVFVGPARGDFSDGLRGNLLCVRGGAYSCYTPIPESSKPVYVEVRMSYSDLKEDLQQSRRKFPNLYHDDAFHVWWGTPSSSPYLTTLPASAVRLKERGYGDHYITESEGYEPHTDAHKYYAYPLGAITAVAIDAPLTLAGNALLLGGAVVGLPFMGIINCYESQTQNAPEATTSSHNKP